MSAKPSVGRSPTGVEGLDEMLRGGIPRGRTVTLVGGPGTGKTILSTQFLVNGITMYGENGLFVSLEESKKHLYQYMSVFKWDLDKLEREGKFQFLDASIIHREPGEVKMGKFRIGRREFSMLGLVNTIEQLAETAKSKRIAVDPLTVLAYQYQDPFDRRTAFVELLETLTATGATCMLTVESRSLKFETDVIEEEYLADGVITLNRFKVGKSWSRALTLRKMRMTEVDEQPRPYKIEGTGINVYSKETIF